MINIKYLILLLFVFLTVSSYSQNSFTKELKWLPHDSKTEIFLQDTSQIIAWVLNINTPSASYKSENIHVKGFDIFILMVDICSGIYCPFIYVFKNEDNFWRLITSTHASLTEQIEVVVDKNQEKIIFKTKAVQIGELPFETLKINSDKSQQ